MGPRVSEEMERIVLRPYSSSTTYLNLKRTGQGVFHVTDDVEMLARAALSEPFEAETVQAQRVDGQVLLGACRWYEFRVTELQDQQERTTIECEVLHQGRWRDFFGFNRAKHAVVEAAILATRTAFIPLGEILRQFEELEIIVEKTAGPAERRAFAFLKEYIEKCGAGH